MRSSFASSEPVVFWPPPDQEPLQRNNNNGLINGRAIDEGSTVIRYQQTGLLLASRDDMIALMLSSSEDPVMTDRCQVPFIDQRNEDRETLEGMMME